MTSRRGSSKREKRTEELKSRKKTCPTLYMGRLLRYRRPPIADHIPQTADLRLETVYRNLRPTLVALVILVVLVSNTLFSGLSC